MPARPTAVLFDLDGTISDSGATIMASLHEVLVAAGFGGLDGRVAREVVGPPLGQTLQGLLGLTPQQSAEVIPAYRALVATRLDRTPPYDGMVDLVRELAAAGVPLAVATSKATSQAEAVLAAYDLSDSFVAVCGSPPDEVTGTKAAVVAEALRRLRAAGADLDGPVMVGDRRHDVEGAAAHDLPTIAVTWGYGTSEEWEQAAAVVRSPQELRSLLRPVATDGPLRGRLAHGGRRGVS